jgi:FKBP-type peptidyl-prolyl cis-trans isomerase FkpA
LADAQAGTPALALAEWGPKIDPLVNVRRQRAADRVKTSSVAYLEKAATEAGAVKTTSGLIYREVLAGIGASPKASDTVKVHYRGTLTDGKVFDSSYERSEPISFPLGGVIPCWTEGVQRMRVGGKARLVCPSALAYGDGGSPDIPGGAALIFEIELLEIVAPSAAPR